MIKDFDIYIPANRLRDAQFVKTIQVETYESEGEEWLTRESLDRIDNETGEAIYQLAYAFAKKAHEGQFRRGEPIPYFTHVERVANSHKDPVRKILAILHDVLEDKRATEDQMLQAGISEGFIEKLRLLDKGGLSYEEYILRIKNSGDQDVLFVKLSDIFDNLRDNPTTKQRIKYCNALRVLLGLEVVKFV